MLACIVGFLLEPPTVFGQQKPPPPHRWTKFVQVEGQPEPVPEEWVSTPEGRFAHSIKLPNPLPKDSGYRDGMTSEQYFQHLCRNEAGEFIYKTVENVEGFYFMRPPKRPTDYDLKDRYKLEAPEIERTFQLLKETPEERGVTFVNPPWARFLYVEEPKKSKNGSTEERYLRVSGYKQNLRRMSVEERRSLSSQYAVVWRGVRRPNDRPLAIAGSELIVLELKTADVMAVQRNFARSGRARNTRDNIWWLNALNCPNTESRNVRAYRFYEFVSKPLRPSQQ